jgi:two-component system, response regulator
MTRKSNVDVLLVAGTVEDAELTRLVYRRSGYQAEESLYHVLSGREALDFLGAASALPKLIILDLNMLGISGVEVLTQLKVNEKTRTIPVVVLASSENPNDRESCQRLQDVAYIVKPFSLSAFHTALEAVFTRWLPQQ